MTKSGYDIRHALLEQARDMAYAEWHAAREVEDSKAKFENRPLGMIPVPTVDDVKKIAKSLYEFVEKM